MSAPVVGFAVVALVIVGRALVVCVHRMMLINRISKAAIRDIHAGREWMWRWQAYDAVSFNRQFWQFWRSLDSFWEWMRPDHEVR